MFIEAVSNQDRKSFEVDNSLHSTGADVDAKFESRDQEEDVEAMTYAFLCFHSAIVFANWIQLLHQIIFDFVLNLTLLWSTHLLRVNKLNT